MLLKRHRSTVEFLPHEKRHRSTVEFLPHENRHRSTVEFLPREKRHRSTVELLPREKRHRSTVEFLPREKRHRSTVNFLPHENRHRSTVVFLPHDVVELILESLPVKSLLKFKCVSKKWRSTIESRRFQERQLVHRRQSRDPDVVFAIIDDLHQKFSIELGSSVIFSFICPDFYVTVTNGTCDGLICSYSLRNPSTVINPATGWHQTFPLSTLQQLYIDKIDKTNLNDINGFPMLGFGKDISRGTFKPVFLYNSSDFGLDNVTTCEVFDFSTNSWRYLFPSSPYQILNDHTPVYLDGSLYWLTGLEETKILSLDLHTETFQLLSDAPFTQPCGRRSVIMCTLDNRLCISLKNWPNQVIWLFDSSGGNKTWKKLCSIDLTKTESWFGEPKLPLLPVSILEKNKLLLQGRGYKDPVVVHDLLTKSYDFVFKPKVVGFCADYFESLFSALSN